MAVIWPQFQVDFPYMLIVLLFVSVINFFQYKWNCPQFIEDAYFVCTCPLAANWTLNSMLVIFFGIVENNSDTRRKLCKLPKDSFEYIQIK